MRLTHVLLPCADVARSLAFYQGLGLTPIVLDREPDGTLRYARLTFPDGDATLSLERSATGTASPGGVVVYLDCEEDLDARVAALASAGYVFASGPETKPWLWREATLLDPDGHTLRLFQAGRYRVDPPWRLPSSVAAGDAVVDLSAFLTTHNHGYVDAAIPSGRDAQIAAYLEQLSAGPATARDQAANTLGPIYTGTFLAFAERMASLAARETDQRRALLGVLAVTLIWRACIDVRPAIPVLGLLYDAAKRAGGDPETLFREVAAICPPDVAPVLRDFLTRPDLGEIVEEMGFSAGRDRDGFRYRRTWGAGQLDLDS